MVKRNNKKLNNLGLLGAAAVLGGVTCIPTGGQLGRHAGDAPTYKLDALSKAATDSCKGAFSLVRLSSDYTGPIVTVKMQKDNVGGFAAANLFYDDESGLYVKSGGQKKISLQDWKKAIWKSAVSNDNDEIYVTKWYNQCNPKSNAFQDGLDALNYPKINASSIESQLKMDFKVGSETGRFLKVPPGLVPLDKKKDYTVTALHAAINFKQSTGTFGGFNFWLAGGGTSTNTLNCFGASHDENEEERYDNDQGWNSYRSPTNANSYVTGVTFQRESKEKHTANSIVKTATISSRINATLAADTSNEDSWDPLNDPSRKGCIGCLIGGGGGTEEEVPQHFLNGELYSLFIFDSKLTPCDLNQLHYTSNPFVKQSCPK